MSMGLAHAHAATPCHRCQSPCEAEDIRCPICGIARAALQNVQREQVQILRCNDCGAAMKYSAEQAGIKCGFCGSKLALETPTDPIEQAEFAVPFAVTPQQAHGVLHQWLGKQGFFTPSDLQSKAQLESLRPLWWASWLVDARTLVSWTADSNAGSGRSAWAPHSGQHRLDFERLVVSASRGLTFDETAKLATCTNLASAQSSWQEGGGPMIEQFDAQRSAARRIVVRAIEATAANRLRQGIIPGSTYRNVHVAVLLEGLVTRRFLLPAFVLAYRYDGKLFRAIVHGQDAGCVFGDVPKSFWKILLVVVGGLLLVAGALAVFAALGR
jgi:hypothetical protein